MKEKKDVLLFGNKKQMLRNNLLLKAGVGSIIAGTITLIIGGRKFYKSIGATTADCPDSNVIDDIYNDLVVGSKK